MNNKNGSLLLLDWCFNGQIKTLDGQKQPPFVELQLTNTKNKWNGGEIKYEIFSHAGIQNMKSQIHCT